MSKPIQAYPPKELREKLRNVAKETDRSISYIIIQALKEYLK
jgi:predicted transcriptional regulator